VSSSHQLRADFGRGSAAKGGGQKSSTAVLGPLAGPSRTAQNTDVSNTLEDASAPSRNDASVVVVEPNDDNRSLYFDLLKGEGWNPTVVEDARTALNRLAASPLPRAVIFDVVLPDMSAVEFCDALNRVDAESVSRRIVITGWLLTPLERAELSKRGVRDIHQKPLDVDTVLELLKA
jgi:CheY-like chemotaxis protein